MNPELSMRDRAAAALPAARFVHDYCRWLQSTARAEGVEVLYFLARDGQLLKRVFDAIIAAGQPTPRTVYLYTSRQAVRICGLANTPWAGTAWLTKPPHGTDLDPQLLGARMGLQPGSALFKAIVAQYERDNATWITALLSDARFADAASAVARRHMECGREYLKRMGLANSGKVALVETGWKGRVARDVAGLAECYECSAFFMGLLGEAPANLASQTWLFDLSSPRETLQFWDRSCAKDLVELICSADHPHLDHYSVRSLARCRTIDPIAIAAGVDRYQSSVLEAVFENAENWSEGWDPVESAHLALAYIERLATAPTEAEVALLGKFDYSPEQTHLLGTPFGAWSRGSRHAP